MVDGTLFDKIEQIARNIRGNDKPFGGLQVIDRSITYSTCDVADISSSYLAISFNSPQSHDQVNQTTNSLSKLLAGPNYSQGKTCRVSLECLGRKKTISLNS
jgi:hypothetical protein